MDARKIRIYTDEHVSKGVIKSLRGRGVDVLTTPEAGMLGASDPEHLELAREEGRVLFTHDKDFLRLHAEGVEHAGIVFASGRTSIGKAVDFIAMLHEGTDAEEMKGRVEYI